MTKTPAAPEVADNSAAITAALLNAVHELFGDVATHCTLPTSKIVVNFYPAKFRHLNEITQLYSEIIGGLTSSELTTLMTQVSKQQEALINEGVSPYQIDPMSLVKDVVGNGSIALKLLDALTVATPRLASMFTDLDQEQFKELEMDEVLLVVYSVFARNYNFFIQRLLPLIAAFTAERQATRK